MTETTPLGHPYIEHGHLETSKVYCNVLSLSRKHPESWTNESYIDRQPSITHRECYNYPIGGLFIIVLKWVILWTSLLAAQETD